MADLKVSDPSRLHLKKELTQIRKAARVLRDPGTTSSWKSPLSSSRSAAVMEAATAAAASSTHESARQNGGNGHLDSHVKEKRVFLYNWKNNKSSSEKSGGVARNGDVGGGDDGSSSGQGSLFDSLSDARYVGDSKSDTYSMILRCRDANLVALGTPMKRGAKKKSKKFTSNTHLDSLSRYKHKDMSLSRHSLNAKRLLEGHSSMGLGLGRDGSVDQSDDTEDYSNSEDLRKIPGLSPLLLKLKHKSWSNTPSKLLKSSRKEDSSYSYSTPALSTSSYNRYGNRNPSTVGSWDATTDSFDEGGDEVGPRLDLPGRQGCGIPCYWSRRTSKHRGGCRSCYSPSLSDTLRRKGTSILCGSQTMYHRRRHSSSSSNKRRIASRSAQGFLPLLTNNGDGRGGSSIGTEHSDDELSTNFEELDLEALSRLDGRRWSSSCRSQDALEIVALNGENDEEGTPENNRSLSQKYKPMFFDELIGQNTVVQSLVNAISRGRIAPVYLFQGPRGTGKTSTARIFAAALNCLATEEMKPCGFCRKCTEFISGKGRVLWEVDSNNKKGIDTVRHLLKKLLVLPPSDSSRYKVFVIDECHLLPPKTWLAFLKFLEEPPHLVVFIFITTDLDNVPRTIQSRCQKYLFNKIKDGDIGARLKKIAIDENLDVESDALDLITLNSDGSLRDAETLLDQLSLLGKRITTSLVNELVGVISDEKLLELLELAMSSNTAETVKRARELMDSGFCPMVLMSQLASLIMDIIAGTYSSLDVKYSNPLFDGRSLTEAELERLKHALKLLSEAEKQLRVSSERSTWFTATLLQMGSMLSPDVSLSGSSRRQSSKIAEGDPSSASRGATDCKQKSGTQYVPWRSPSPASLRKAMNESFTHQGELLSQVDGHRSNSKPSLSRFKDGGAFGSSHEDEMVGNTILTCRNLDKLEDIWTKCIEKCHSKTLRQLLHAHGMLFSICEVEGVLVAYVAFGDRSIKSRAERFLSSITNSIEIILQHNVEVRIIYLPDGRASINHANAALEGLKQTEKTVANERERKTVCSDLNSHQDPFKASGGSISDLVGKLRGADNYSNCSPLLDVARSAEFLDEGNVETSGTKERRPESSMQRVESIIREQRLETAWLQVSEKGTPGSLGLLKPEKNQILPQEGIYHQAQTMNSSAFSSQHWEDELNHELKVLKINDGKTIQKDQAARRGNHCPVSPSLLHDSSFVNHYSKDGLGYDSGSGGGGCSGLFCWKNGKSRNGGKVKGTPIRSRKGGRISLFGGCRKVKNSEGRFRT